MRKNKINSFHVSIFPPRFKPSVSTILQPVAAPSLQRTAVNQHTKFQTPQPHKQFTIETVTSRSLLFPCTHSNQLLSLQSLYTADLTTSQQHTSVNISSTFPILSAPRYYTFCIRSSIQTAVRYTRPCFPPFWHYFSLPHYSKLHHVKFSITKLTLNSSPEIFSFPYPPRFLS